MKPFYTIILLFLLFGNTFCAAARLFPQEGTQLHYRLIGFSFGQVTGAKNFVLQIAPVHTGNADSFARMASTLATGTGTQAVATVPYFGTAYTWRVAYINRRNDTFQYSPLYHFTTGKVSYTDTARYRLRVTTNKAAAHNGLFIFSDCSRSLYDINGQPVWYVPLLPGVLDTTVPLRDLKITPQNTITFIANTQAYEISYDGQLLWQAPDDGKVSGDTSEFYHHEFTRLRNGHYMIAGNQYIRKYLPNDFAQRYPDNDNIKQNNGRYYVDVAYGTLIEYDSLKNIIWSWKAADYFTDEDLLVPTLFENARVPGFHHNGFWFDEKNNVIYNSFRDINRIVKISYHGKQPLAAYGAVAGKPPLFMGQHNCRINKKGQLYLFNNQFAHNREKKETGQPSSVLVLEEPRTDRADITVVSTFDCDIDNNAAPNAKGGGSVEELENGDILVCMGTVNRIFILSKNDVLWNAFTELKNEGRWLPQSNYRVSAMEGTERLKKLLFNH